MDFDLYNVNSIRGFTSIINVVCEKTIMLWVFPTAYKKSLVRIIHFILTTLNNEQHLWKRVRVYNYGALVYSTDVTNLLVDEFRITMENTGGYASWIYVKNERHSRSIHTMVRADIVDINQNGKICSVKQKHQQKYVDAISIVH